MISEQYGGKASKGSCCSLTGDTILAVAWKDLRNTIKALNQDSMSRGQDFNPQAFLNIKPKCQPLYSTNGNVISK
jgi:hypothetical protein